MDVGETVFTFGLEKADPQRVVRRPAKPKRRNVTRIQVSLRRLHVRTVEYPDAAAQQLCRA